MVKETLSVYFMVLWQGKDHEAGPEFWAIYDPPLHDVKRTSLRLDLQELWKSLLVYHNPDITG